MSDYITLLGAEDVQRAASSIRSAAEAMQSAADSLENSLSRNQRFMDDWILRLQEAITHMPDPG